MRAITGALTVLLLILLGATAHFIQEAGNTRHAAKKDRQHAEEAARRAELLGTRASSAERAADDAEQRRVSAEKQRAKASSVREAARKEAREAEQRATRADAARAQAASERDDALEAGRRLRAENDARRAQIAAMEKKLGAAEVRGAASAKELGDLSRERDALDRELQGARTALGETGKLLHLAVLRQARARRFHRAAADEAATLGERLVRSERLLGEATRERDGLGRRLQSSSTACEQARRRLNVAVLREQRAERRRVRAKKAAEEADEASRAADEARQRALREARQATEDRESMSIQVLEMRAAGQKAENARASAERDIEKARTALKGAEQRGADFQKELEKEQQLRAKLQASLQKQRQLQADLQASLEKQRKQQAELQKSLEKESGVRKKAQEQSKAREKEAGRLAKERDAARRTADEIKKARRAADARVTKLKEAHETSLQEVARLTDNRRCRALLAQGKRLWPATPEHLPEMESWLAKARDLLERGTMHRQVLAQLRGKALPYSEKMLARDRAHNEEQHPQVVAELRSLADSMAKAKTAKDAQALKALNDRATSLERRLAQRHTWEFRDPHTAITHEMLADLELGLADLGPAADAVQRRREAAASLQRRSLEAHRKTWAAAVAEIRDPQRSPQYRGLKIAPQLGLVPLGIDPASGLQEFAHLLSGKAPTRDPETGKLHLAPESGLVLVLLPGGSFAMGGAPSKKVGQPNHDPHATPAEAPVHRVTLAPFFISKFEMTQSQWAGITGTNPSSFRKDQGDAGIPGSPTHPVEQVSWNDAAEVVARLDLALPTEAQWEYACRGSAGSVFAVGDAVSSLQGVANIADEGSKDFYPPSWSFEKGFRDGFPAHAPVGTFRPNPFGLHDVHGNIAEWCRDRLAGYEVATTGGDALRSGGDPRLRVARGGSYARPATDARAAARGAHAPDFRFSDLGVRPARPLR